jgi:hypothetical protein
MKTQDNLYRSRIRRSTNRLFYWAASWLLATGVLAFGPRFLWDGAHAATIGAFAIALSVGIGMIVANKKHLENLDEMQRRVMLNAMAVTLSVPIVIGIPYSLLANFGLAPFEAGFAHLMMLMGLTYLTAVVAGMRHYR